MMNRFKLLSVVIWTFILSACVNTIELTISFESNGGSVVESITTDGQNTIQFPEDPTKEGYVFAGWYWDNNTFRDLFTLVSLTERGITSNLVVYAKWEDDESYIPIGSVKVTFDSSGGTSVLPVFITPGKTILIPEVSKLGYTLEGWYTSVNNGVTLDERWSFTSSIVNNNITLYAKWSVNQYTLTFNSNGGTSLNSSVFDFNEAIDVSFTTTKTGHTFIGWFIDENLSISFDLETMPAEDVTLYAKWQINQYTMTFDSNGGTNVSSILLDFNALMNAPEQPSKEGFTFDGWYIDSTLVNAYTFTNMPDENLTLYARWNTLLYTITYVIDEFTSNLGNPNTFDLNSSITFVQPVKAGHTFEGFYLTSDFTGDVITTIPTGTKGNMTLYAKFVINAYVISFNSNGGNQVSTIVFDDVSDLGELTIPTRDGYRFLGWFNEMSFVTLFTPSSLISREAITLHAKWEVITYTVSYELNGGINDINNQQSYNVNSGFNLFPPSKTGHRFDGWYEDSDFSGNVLSFVSIESRKDLILFAKFSVNSYEIIFNTNGGSELIRLVLDFGSTIEPFNETTKEGYTFGGWFSDGLLSIPFALEVMSDKNLILYAKWNIITYNITYVLDEGINHLSNPNTYNITSQVTLGFPSKTGYTFEGWYEDSDFLGNPVSHIPIGSIGDVTLYAKFVEQIDNMLYLTTSQLSAYNGLNGAFAYIGYKGVIYDVTGNPSWPKGVHRGYISAGQDVTLLFASSGAPHGDSNITGLPIVGYIVTN